MVDFMEEHKQKIHRWSSVDLMVTRKVPGDKVKIYPNLYTTN